VGCADHWLEHTLSKDFKLKLRTSCKLLQQLLHQGAATIKDKLQVVEHCSVCINAGWAAGTLALMLGFFVTLWTSRIVASFHEHKGHRHIRYRDLAAIAMGKRTWSS